MIENSPLLPAEQSESKEMFAPYWRMFKKFLFGQERPSLWVRLYVYFGMYVSSIFGLWSLISYAILKNPNYLKYHKQVDVLAIVELRGRELQMEGEIFIKNLELFHVLSMGSWLTIFVATLFVWRKKKYATHTLILAWLVYLVAMLSLLGPQYFVEDTTTFDKFFLITLLVFTIVQYIVHERKKLEKIDIADEEFQNEEQTDIL